MDYVRARRSLRAITGSGIFRDESIVFALQKSLFSIGSSRGARIGRGVRQTASADGLGWGSSHQRMIDSRSRAELHVKRFIVEAGSAREPALGRQPNGTQKSPRLWMVRRKYEARRY
jgi:hypothetical protein